MIASATSTGSYTVSRTRLNLFIISPREEEVGAVYVTTREAWSAALVAGFGDEKVLNKLAAHGLDKTGFAASAEYSDAGIRAGLY